MFHFIIVSTFIFEFPRALSFSSLAVLINLPKIDLVDYIERRLGGRRAFVYKHEQIAFLQSRRSKNSCDKKMRATVEANRLFSSTSGSCSNYSKVVMIQNKET